MVSLPLSLPPSLPQAGTCVPWEGLPGSERPVASPSGMPSRQLVPTPLLPQGFSELVLCPHSVLLAAALVGGIYSADGGVFNAPRAGAGGVGTCYTQASPSPPTPTWLSCHSTVNPPAVDFLLRLSTWFFKVTFPSCFLARGRKIMSVLSDTL